MSETSEQATLQASEVGAEVRELARGLQNELEQLIQGQGEVIQQLLISLVAGGHILLEGVPGVAKTLLVRSLAASLRCQFSRIQFTPDLMPSDVTGVNVFDARASRFEFRPGPLFGELVLADEINRAPAKTQAALLEAMQERQVSIDGVTHTLPPVFTVIATQNPVEYEGTYPLPEAQLDRFLMKVLVGYPSESAERLMLQTMHRLGEKATQPTQVLRALADPAVILRARAYALNLHIDEPVLEYILKLVRQSRSHRQLSLGCSPRAAVMLMSAAKALAVLRGRTFVTPDEVQSVFLPTLRHRVQLTPEAEIEGLSADAVLKSLLTQVAIPR
ncbi:MAG: AAA family ATPase [Myxococcota bacterium]